MGSEMGVRLTLLNPERLLKGIVEQIGYTRKLFVLVIAHKRPRPASSRAARSGRGRGWRATQSYNRKLSVLLIGLTLWLVVRDLRHTAE